jgi:hypothetical protein
MQDYFQPSIFGLLYPQEDFSQPNIQYFNAIDKTYDKVATLMCFVLWKYVEVHMYLLLKVHLLHFKPTIYALWNLLTDLYIC